MFRNEPLGSEVLTFLKQLKRNNNREWFQKHKERYLREHRDPLLRFIELLRPELERISPHFRADPRPIGGSLFRIYRDTRFSRDKRPYKTHAGIQFRHERAKDVHAPGFYLHLEPGGVFAGIGLWHPDSETLKKIRDAIVEEPTRWKRASTGKAFRQHYSLAGESLKRAPRGYDPNHALIGDLKRKDFIAVHEFEDDDVTAPGFHKQLARTFRAGSPFMKWLTGAVGLRW